MTHTTTTRTRFKTGEESPYNARYRFDAYVDGSRTPQPTVEEEEIDLTVGENFPPIRSAEKACWWKVLRKH